MECEVNSGYFILLLVLVLHCGQLLLDLVSQVELELEALRLLVISKAVLVDFIAHFLHLLNLESHLERVIECCDCLKIPLLLIDFHGRLLVIDDDKEDQAGEDRGTAGLKCFVSLREEVFVVDLAHVLHEESVSRADFTSRIPELLAHCDVVVHVVDDAGLLADAVVKFLE